MSMMLGAIMLLTATTQAPIGVSETVVAHDAALATYLTDAVLAMLDLRGAKTVRLVHAKKGRECNLKCKRKAAKRAGASHWIDSTVIDGVLLILTITEAKSQEVLVRRRIRFENPEDLKKGVAQVIGDLISESDVSTHEHHEGCAHDAAHGADHDDKAQAEAKSSHGH